MILRYHDINQTLVSLSSWFISPLTTSLWVLHRGVRDSSCTFSLQKKSSLILVSGTNIQFYLSVIIQCFKIKHWNSKKKKRIRFREWNWLGKQYFYQLFEMIFIEERRAWVVDPWKQKQRLFSNFWNTWPVFYSVAEFRNQISLIFCSSVSKLIHYSNGFRDDQKASLRPGEQA